MEVHKGDKFRIKMDGEIEDVIAGNNLTMEKSALKPEFITLFRLQGAPYTITKRKFENSVVKKLEH